MLMKNKLVTVLSVMLLKLNVVIHRLAPKPSQQKGWQVRFGRESLQNVACRGKSGLQLGPPTRGFTKGFEEARKITLTSAGCGAPWARFRRCGNSSLPRRSRAARWPGTFLDRKVG